MMVYRRCGGLHKALVCSQISCSNNFNSLGFLILKLRILRVDCCETTLIVRTFSLKLITGKEAALAPVLVAYMSFKTSRAASASPHSSKNLGLSGKKKSQKPIKRLGMEHVATNRFQLANLKLSASYTNSIGIMIQAIPGRTITPRVQNSSIQHRMVSRYFPGWNSPK
jgi:hypothetical protein